MSDLLIKLEEKSQADSEAVKVAQDHFHAVSAGLSSNEGGEDKTLADQIMSKLTIFLDGERIFLLVAERESVLFHNSSRNFIGQDSIGKNNSLVQKLLKWTCLAVFSLQQVHVLFKLELSYTFSNLYCGKHLTCHVLF